EYTSNNTLALEVVPKERRGFVGGVLQGAYPIGFFFVSVITAIMLAITTREQYYFWGWRIPFVIGAILAFLFLLYYRTVPESKMWEAAEKSATPLRDLMSGPHRRSLLQVLVMMLGFWFSAQAAIGIMPGVMIQHLHVSGRLMTVGLLITSFIQFFAFVGFGLFSQVAGRRFAIVVSGVLTLVLGCGLYAIATAIGLSGNSPIATTFIACLFYLVVVSPWGIVSTYLCERFPTNIRASGYGIGYSLAVIVPAFAAFYMLGLATFMPYVYTPVVLVGISGILIIVGALMGPETREVELHLPDLGGNELAGQAVPGD
ncbi:MAG: MFS transporter, partial [Acetobacteraceae bacterium]